MISRVHSILFVKDQAASTEFFRSLLRTDPILDVPGMTEFALTESHILGLMPDRGARKVLGIELGASTPTGELYVIVEDAHAWHERALDLGATELSPVTVRDWGDIAGYTKTIDGHVLAFAEPAIRI